MMLDINGVDETIFGKVGRKMTLSQCHWCRTVVDSLLIAWPWQPGSFGSLWWQFTRCSGSISSEC
jgi:hypothetical protein